MLNKKSYNVIEKVNLIRKVDDVLKLTKNFNFKVKASIVKGISLATVFALLSTSNVYAGVHTVSNMDEYRQVLLNDLLNQDSYIEITINPKSNPYSSEQALEDVMINTYEETEMLLGEFDRSNRQNVKYQLTHSYSPSKNEYYIKKVSHDILYKTPKEDLIIVQQMINEILDEIISDSMTEGEKIRAIYDFVLETVSYKKHRLNDKDWVNIVKERNLLGALNGDGVVCDGYAMLLSKMLSTIGIENKIIDGVANNGTSSEAHIWNLVKLNGKYYHVDSTWGDVASVAQQNHYFMTSDAVMKQTHTWDEAAFPSAPLVFDLSTEKEDILNDAISAVELAEGSKLQIDVDSARVKVSKLDEADKSALNTRLDAVQTIIDADNAYASQLEEAVNAVIQAESSKTQVDIDSARIKVEALKESDKSSLNIRLDSVESAIAYQTKLNEAVSAVEKAEGSKLQVDIDSARVLVNSLDNEDKTSLSSRLDEVQSIIDADKAYETQLEEAVSAVVKAEGSKTQIDIDSARTKVEGLNELDKSSLNTRLDIIQEEIDALLYLEKLEAATNLVNSASTLEDIANAQILVNALKESDKSSLQSILDTKKSEIEEAASYEEKMQWALSAVEKAEGSKVQADVDSARIKVDKLNEEDKSPLSLRLDVVQELINEEKAYDTQLDEAVSAVIQAESSKTQVDIDNARIKVEALKEFDKESLNARLDIVQSEIDSNIEYQAKLEEATIAVVKAEESKLQVDIDDARVMVESLEVSDKESLNARLDIVQSEIDSNIEYQAKLEEATIAVVKAEESKLQVDIDDARVMVENLMSSDKESLNARLDLVQEAIDAEKDYETKLTLATESVVKAEGSKLQVDIDSARNKVDGLKDLDKEPLMQRLDVLEAQVQHDLAVKAIEKAEESGLLEDVLYARSLLSKLADSSAKLLLLERIEVVEKAIEQGENGGDTGTGNDGDGDGDDEEETPSNPAPTNPDPTTPKPEEPSKPAEPTKPAPTTPDTSTPNPTPKPSERRYDNDRKYGYKSTSDYVETTRNKPVSIYSDKDYDEIEMKTAKLTSINKAFEYNAIINKFGEGAGSITVNGLPILKDTKEIVYDKEKNLVFVPLKNISTAFGFSVNANKNSISIVKNGKNISLNFNESIAYVNQNQVVLNAAPKIINGKAYVSIESIVELLGVNADYSIIGDKKYQLNFVEIINHLI